MNLPIWQTKKNLVCSCEWTPIITYPSPPPPTTHSSHSHLKKNQQNKTHTLSLTYKICTSYLQVYQQLYCLLFHFQQVSENSFVTVQSSRGSYSVLHIEPKQGKKFFVTLVETFGKHLLACTHLLRKSEMHIKLFKTRVSSNIKTYMSRIAI